MYQSALGTLWRVLALGTIACTATPISALSQLVDRGEFRLSQNGEQVGIEEFVIQKSGSGLAQTTLAKGTVTLDSGVTITTQLQVTGPTFTVYRYSVAITGEDEKTVTVARIGDRLQARTVAPWGEELREYRATSGTLLLDRSIAHHNFLLAPFLDDLPPSVHTVAPLSENEESLSGLATASGVQDVGGEPVEVRQLQFTTAAGSREVWFDASGRVVRVSDSAGFVAERIPAS